MPTTIVFQNVSKHFDSVQPLQEVSFSIEEGEFFVLVGPSGSGKSTLLRMIAGLESISSGSILFNGHRINEVPARQRDIGMVFQNYALYPHLSVFDNIAFPLMLRNEPKHRIKEKVEEVASALTISDILHRKPKQLSGGQRQRVAVGRAIIRKPSVFLFDEPLSNLDAQLRTHMRAELKTLQCSLGVTTVYVTHDQVEAMTMASRMAILHQGALQQIGTPAHIYSSPANTFVASFTGSPPMNLILHNSSIIGVRPEHLTDVATAGGIELSGIVKVSEFVGSEWLVHAVVNGTTVIRRCNTAPKEHMGDPIVWFAPEQHICRF
jgi:ABC-type sugar transport system ATPase subunit